jgi:hypothetical protein
MQSVIENTNTLEIFVKIIFLSLLLTVERHACLSSRLATDSSHSFIRDVISLLSQHDTNLRINCSECFILNSEIRVAGIAHFYFSIKK